MFVVSVEYLANIERRIYRLQTVMPTIVARRSAIESGQLYLRFHWRLESSCETWKLN